MNWMSPGGVDLFVMIAISLISQDIKNYFQLYQSNMNYHSMSEAWLYLSC